jgi:hypothetical protein
MQEQKKNIFQAGIAATAFLLFVFSLAPSGQAAEIIQGQYISKTATSFVLKIQVGRPAPANLIVIQRLPPGTAISNASPPPNKYNKKKGVVRWLLRNVRPGTLQVSLNLKNRVNPGQVRAEIRCKNPVSRKLVTTQVQ